MLAAGHSNCFGPLGRLETGCANIHSPSYHSLSYPLKSGGGLAMGKNDVNLMTAESN